MAKATLQSLLAKGASIVEAILGSGKNQDGTDFTVSASVAAGTNNIGDVGVLTLPVIPVGTNSIGGTKDNGPHWTPTHSRVASADMSAVPVDISDAPTAGQMIYLDDLIISVDAAMRVDIMEETSGTILASFYMAANSTIQITPRDGLKLAAADMKLQAQTSAAGDISITACYHSEA
jgi:hypothetical protein